MYPQSLDTRADAGRGPGRVALFICSVVASVVAPIAIAAPPSFTGSSIVANPEGAFILVNLRQQNVVTGSAPISIRPGQVFINGAPSTLVAVRQYPSEGPPSVCVRIEDEGFTPSRDLTVSVELTATNLLQQSAMQVVNFTLQAGPIVNENDPQALAACLDPNTAPVANAGGNRTVVDSNGVPGENVVLDGSASTDVDATTILSYEWFLGQTSLGPSSTSPQLTAALPDGVSNITLIVTDDSGDSATNSSSSQAQITVNPAQQPTVSAGADQTLEDSDGEPGEVVTLTGTAADSDGSIQTFEWLLGSDSLGTGATLQTRLPDGANVVTLRVTDNAGVTASDTVQITIAAPAERRPLAELPNLTPNQQKMAVALDRICGELDGSDTLTPDQQDLLQRCNGLYDRNTPENQTAALDELNGEDFAAARTQTLLFANLQYVGVMDRLMALRGGAQGLSLAGLNIVVDGKAVSLASLQEIAEQILGGGASSDADEPGGLLSDKWGLWVRGNYSFGDKEASAASPSFDADQWAILGGLDYRLADNAVIGGSLAYGNSSVDFNPSGEGSLDTESWAASLYGSVYAAKNFYFDGIVNVADSSYDATRNITYVDGTGLITADARGDTDGLTLSGGLSGGYDFLLGGLTVSPNLGVFYIDAQIDDFSEQGAAGLNLVYDEQKFKSLTGNLGLRLTYAWKLSWGVVLPHLRADFVREFEDDVDVFGVRFAADPNANSTPPILVETDNPDTSYWRFAGGLSAQFKYGISGYIEYQRLESFEFISFQDVSLGLRMQRSF